eukprot:TRINITY_DN2644_c1_g1_i3.p1 TRINITY_DN2644_c1_g1~~TRINITY_DN2644_c1_g1_i3.p1  ORF type:complete len:236 (-),score=10.58 TRINITY_DN2644_c1_g1_i3:370-1077(-)
MPLVVKSCRFGQHKSYKRSLRRKQTAVVTCTQIKAQQQLSEARAWGQTTGVSYSRSNIIQSLNNRGFTDAQVSRITDFLLEQPEERWHSSYITQQLHQLQVLMPGINFVHLVAQHPNALIIEPWELVDRLLLIRRYMENIDAVEFACQEPRLLTCDRLQERLEMCGNVLKGVLPSQYTLKYVKKIIKENPQFVFRLERFQGKSFSELPMDVQNQLAIAGGGGGASYKSWHRASSP